MGNTTGLPLSDVGEIHLSSLQKYVAEKEKNRKEEKRCKEQVWCGMCIPAPLWSRLMIVWMIP